MSTTVRAVRRLLVLVLLVPLLGTVPLAAPAMAQDLEWSVGPATAEGPDERISLRHVIEPGATVADHVAVTNLGAAPATFTVVTGDGVLGANGAFDIVAGEPTDSGAWITVDGLTDGTVTLEAGETRVLPVSITVPEDANPGDHPAGIAVAMTSGTSDVSVTHRIGVRLHLQVAGEIESALEVRDVETSYRSSWIPFAPGTLEVRYTIENAGNVRIGAGTQVSASSLFGIASAEELVTVDELLPGDTTSGVVELDVLPLFVASGEIDAAGLVVGQDEVADPGSATADFTQLTVSWTGLLLIALVVAFLVWRRRRAAPVVAEAPADEREPVAAGR